MSESSVSSPTAPCPAIESSANAPQALQDACPEATSASEMIVVRADAVKSPGPEVARTSAPSQGGASYLYLLAAFVVVTAGVRMAQEILQLLLLSVFLAVVGVPVYAWLVQNKIASWLSLLIVISGLMLSTLVVLWIVMTSLADFTSRQEHYADQLRERTRPLQRWLEDIIPEKPVASVANDALTSNSEDQSTAPASQIADSGKPPATTAVSAESNVPPTVNDLDKSEASVLEPDVTETEEDDKRETDETAERSSLTDANVSEPAAKSPELPDLSPVFDPQSDQGAGWLQPRRVTVPPQSRRSWRELIASQFDPSRAISMAANIALSISQIVSNTMLILLTVVFILLEASTFPRKLRAAFGDHPETQNRYRTIVERIRSYLVIKTAMSLLTGTLIAIWLWLFGVPYAGLWGMLAFLLNYIPNIGSIIAAVPALLVAWLDLGWLVSVATGIGYVVVNMGVGNILEPRVLGRGMGLSALVVFCSMVFWGWALGPVGMLLSVPLTMTARVAFEGFDDTRWIGTLLGDSE